MTEVSRKNLLELAEEIEDGELRKKTKELIEKLELSNDDLEYEKSDLEEIPCWIGGHHYYEGGLIEHIHSVVNLCMDIVDNLEDFYDKELDRDSLISAALLHDLAKQFIIEDMDGFRDYKLDHEVWISCELYSRGFPEKVIEIIMGHGGETHEPMPKSDEARILHHADSLDAEMNEDEVFGGGAILEL